MWTGIFATIINDSLFPSTTHDSLGHESRIDAAAQHVEDEDRRNGHDSRGPLGSERCKMWLAECH